MSLYCRHCGTTMINGQCVNYCDEKKQEERDERMIRELQRSKKADEFQKRTPGLVWCWFVCLGFGACMTLILIVNKPKHHPEPITFAPVMAATNTGSTTLTLRFAWSTNGQDWTTNRIPITVPILTNTDYVFKPVMIP